MIHTLRHLAAAVSLAFAALPAQAFETKATAAWVYDVTTSTVLMDKNADVPMPPASMSKLMTINMMFEALADGRVTMDSQFAVSDRAMAIGGSTMFLQETDRPTARELIYGMIVNSGNDACIVVAEGLAGTEEAFSLQMTERARALGMTASVLKNSSGWPEPGHVMSMRDLGILTLHLIEDFPEFYPFFAETEFDYKGRAPDNRFNRNPLLGLGLGADGLKTGFTQEAGFGLAGSAKQGDRRVIFVITGLASDAARAEESERIVTWAFRQFSERTVAAAGTRLAEAEVHLGDAATVGLVPAEDVRLLVPAIVRDRVTAEVVYHGPLLAPIAAGTPVAELIVHVPDLPDRRIPLVAETDVGTAGFLRRLMTAGRTLVAQYIGSPAS